MERLSDWKFQSQPGEKYAYSNANYWVFSRRISEKEFQEYLKQKIFSPLRMDDSFTIAHSRDSAQNRQLNLMILDGRKLQYDN